ncbi:hypothetical protein HZA33_02135 [Candidatus Pacearchaeota archaeon]|nr:hypothetical protein [Candidatus Pacearchaeota archaeon]
MEENVNQKITGEEKVRYLACLDRFLYALQKNLYQQDAKHLATLQAFGVANNWDWARLPEQESTYAEISSLVEIIRENYRWFDWITNQGEKNRGYFEELTISSESGLPWAFDFIELHRLKTQSEELLAKMPSYEECAGKIKETLLEDKVPVLQLDEEIKKFHVSAMKRNFLEQLQTVRLLGWESSKYSLEPCARKVKTLGGESLWNIVYATFSPASGMFQIYLIDTWQDILEPQITETEHGTVISDALKNSFNFGKDNAAWYVLKCLDDSFKSLHPVHVSSALIGPFENKFLTKSDEIKALPITSQLLKEDKETGLLRFSRQYSYAPNHEDTAEGLRQIIYRENWSDEVIVCPGKYSSRVADSVLGTAVRILEV